MCFFSPIINSNSSQSAYDHELLDKIAQVKTKWNSFKTEGHLCFKHCVKSFQIGVRGRGVKVESFVHLFFEGNVSVIKETNKFGTNKFYCSTGKNSKHMP